MRKLVIDRLVRSFPYFDRRILERQSDEELLERLRVQIRVEAGSIDPDGEDCL